MLYTGKCPNCGTIVRGGHGTPLKRIGTPLRTCEQCGKPYIDGNMYEWSVIDIFYKLYYYFLANNRGWPILLLSILSFVEPICLIILALWILGCVAYVKASTKEAIEESRKRTSDPQYLGLLILVGYEPIDNRVITGYWEKYGDPAAVCGFSGEDDARQTPCAEQSSQADSIQNHNHEHPPAAIRHNSTIPHSRQNRFDSIFNSHLLKCGEVLSTSGLDYTASNMFDIYAIVYVISDFAVFNAGKNRDAATARMLPHIFRELSYLSSTDPKPQFRERIGFYSEVIRGIPLHAHCLPGVDISDANPVLGCAIAFCDCFLHPAYISNYNAAPQLSALDVFVVATDLLEPLNEALTALYNDIYDYAE